jgi:glycopeptide antibiotics resistance protein
LAKRGLSQAVYLMCCKNIGLPLHIRWSIYAALATLAFTLSPFNFDPNTSQVFTWRWGAFDLFSNLFLLLPIGAALGLSRANLKFRHVLLYFLFALLLSFTIETMQLFITVRTSQYWDVICNVTSFMLGLMIGQSFKPIKLHFNQLATTILKNTEAFDRLISILIAITLLLVIRAISSSASIEYYDIALLCLAFFVIAHIFISISVEQQEPYHLQATVMYCTYLSLSTFVLLLQDTNAILVLITSLSAGMFFTLIIARKQLKNKVITLLTYLVVGVFLIYLIGLTLTEISAVLAFSEYSNNSEILNRSVMANKLVMAILMGSILLDCLKFISIKLHITKLFNLIFLSVLAITAILFSLTLFGLISWQENNFMSFFCIAIIVIVWVNLSISQQRLRGINISE